jgi:2,4-dienoyl-CoA reductase-like NADH-dependent reductase (Old Yellow Enzyme family)
MKYMSISLFEPYGIAGLELRNRFVRSATWDGTADNSGNVTDASVALYRELGKGGVGLIISGYAFVSPLGQAVHGQYGIYTDDMISGLHRLVGVAHQGGAKIVLQIVHAGINSNYLHYMGITALAVSSLRGIGIPHREMTDEEIQGIVSDFVSAAVRGKEAGFDAIQLHASHGYLMSQFLSPLFNLRTDRWGGSMENRRRFHIEVIRSIRHAIGADFPLMIKFGVQDDYDRGLSLKEGLETAKQMVETGIDAVEVSAGIGMILRVLRKSDPEQVYFRDRAAAVKRVVTVPIMLVGGIRRLETAISIVDSGDADLISMCRPFIMEPNLVNRWRGGNKEPARCISCNECLSMLAEGITLKCGQLERKEGEIG